MNSQIKQFPGAGHSAGPRKLAAAGLKTVLDSIYPPALYCICCGKIIDETRPYRLCNDCMDSVKWADGRTCEVCGKPLGENNPGTVCYYCNSHTHRFTRGFTCA